MQFWSKNGSKAPRLDECALKASVKSVLLFCCKNYFICCLQSPFIELQYFGGWMEGRKPGACRGEGTFRSNHLNFSHPPTHGVMPVLEPEPVVSKASLTPCLFTNTAWKDLLLLNWPQKALQTHICLVSSHPSFSFAAGSAYLVVGGIRGAQLGSSFPSVWHREEWRAVGCCC